MRGGCCDEGVPVAGMGSLIPSMVFATPSASILMETLPVPPFTLKKALAAVVRVSPFCSVSWIILSVVQAEHVVSCT